MLRFLELKRGFGAECSNDRTPFAFECQKAALAPKFVPPVIRQTLGMFQGLVIAGANQLDKADNVAGMVETIKPIGRRAVRGSASEPAQKRS